MLHPLMSRRFIFGTYGRTEPTCLEKDEEAVDTAKEAIAPEDDSDRREQGNDEHAERVRLINMAMRTYVDHHASRGPCAACIMSMYHSVLPILSGQGRESTDAAILDTFKTPSAQLPDGKSLLDVHPALQQRRKYVAGLAWSLQSRTHTRRCWEY